VDPSSRAKRSGVKGQPDKGGKTPGWTRHLEGWELGVLIVFIAGAAVTVSVHRPVDPVDLPEPRLSPRALHAVASHDEALAARVEAENAREARLPFEVRALGSAVAAYGLAEVRADDGEIIAARRAVASAAKLAAPHGEEALAKLRAYQLRAFLRGLARFEAGRRGAEVPKEVHELGGSFVETARKRGWIEGKTLAIDDAVRRAMFKKRWNELTYAKGPAFDLTLDEHRALYRFLLLHPPADEIQAASPVVRVEHRAYLTEQYRLRKIDELSKIDPDYPANLARGVALYRIGRYPQAEAHFTLHLEAHPEGPYTQRAQNYLRASLAHTHEDL
jgi:hypothetical protein